MSTLRRRLPRLAALVLLVWLFASGVAFANACQAAAHLDCLECCEEAKAPSAWSSSDRSGVASSAARVTVAAPPAAFVQPPVPPLIAAAMRPATDPPDRGGARIPIAFLRLAL